jgi:hypothetical protein
MAKHPETDYEKLKELRLVPRDNDGCGNPNSDWKETATGFTDAYLPWLIRVVKHRCQQQGLPPHEATEAEDRVVGFLTTEFIRLLQPNGKGPLSVFELYQRDRGGSFHNFLATKCWWYVQHENRKNTKAPGGGRSSQVEASPAPDSEETEMPVETVGREPLAERCAERAQGLILLGEALVLWKADRKARGDLRRWNLFWRRTMEPCLSGQPRPTVKAVYAKLGYASAEQAANHEATMWGQIEKFLRASLEKRIANDRLLQGVTGKNAKAIKKELVDAALRDFRALMSREIQQRNLNTAYRRGKWRPDKDDGDASVQRQQAFGDSGSAETPPQVDRGALKRYFARLLDEDGDSTPYCSDDAKGLPELIDCSLYDIALILTADPAPRENEEHRIEFLHYLKQPLFDRLLQERHQERLTQVANESELLQANVGEVLFHEDPPLELLRGLKDTVKVLRRAADDDGYANSVLVAVYYLCAAAAMAAHGQAIVRCSDEELATNFRWLAQLPWADEPTKQLAERALKRLCSEEDASGSGATAVA